ncbi:MAG TPA: hypothetical protein PLA69_01130 [Flavobacterium sp.]|nr:hypothetical protein [Flavobacterium sp.]
MEELDLLKKDWKRRENAFEQVSEPDIYKMIHKSSSSLVRWILIISIVELVFWTAIGMVAGTDEYLDGMDNEAFRIGLSVLTYVNYAVVIGFIYLFYRNYVQISTIADTRTLMKDILRTRRTVQYYVWYNLAMIGLSMAVGFVIAIVCSPQVAGLKDVITHDNWALTKTVALLFVVLCLSVGLVWVIYRLIYGTLMRRLLANYRELKKIDFD